MENDQGAAPVESDVLARMEALLDLPDDGQQEEEEETAETPETEESEPAEEDAETQEEETEEKAEEPEPLEELTWNGETKKVTKAELKELAQKGFDYTQKTQALADERKQVDAQIQAAKQSLQIQNQQIETIAQVKAIDSQLAQYSQINWHQLAEQDPVKYLQLNQSYRDLKESRESKVREVQQQAEYLQQASAKTLQETLQREAKALSESPEFSGEKGTQNKAKVAQYLKTKGFSEEEISQVIDHRHVLIAWEAAQWNALRKAGPEISKKAAIAPKVVKPGTPKQPTRQPDRDAFTALKKTGRGEYAAKLIENMI